MIDYVIGQIKKVEETSLTILVNGLGLAFQIPHTQNLKEGDSVELYSYLHWNSENGPSLFAFRTKLEREVFLMIIECSKIGPKIALSILSQMPPEEFLEVISSADEKKLSSINGIGLKKAEQIIIQLKHKVAKLITSGKIKIEEKHNFAQWQNLSEALISLGYNRQEINQAIVHLRKEKTQNVSFDQLLRRSLSFLSKGI